MPHSLANACIQVSGWEHPMRLIVAHNIRRNAALHGHIMVIWRQVLCNGQLDATAILHLEEVLYDAFAEGLLAYHFTTLVILHSRK